MFSPCRNSAVLALLLSGACALALSACDREKREYRGQPFAETQPDQVQVSTLRPGNAPQAAPDPRGKMYEGNAFHISQGQKYYTWFNCVGCHSHGGGGMGPPLMDTEWRYGGRIDQIYASIAQGRPNGMPAWQGKIPDTQIWELAAYVRSLSGNVPPAANGSRTEEMSNIPPPDLMKPQKPASDASGVTMTPK